MLMAVKGCYERIMGWSAQSPSAAVTPVVLPYYQGLVSLASSSTPEVDV